MPARKKLCLVGKALPHSIIEGSQRRNHSMYPEELKERSWMSAAYMLSLQGFHSLFCDTIQDQEPLQREKNSRSTIQGISSFAYLLLSSFTSQVGSHSSET